MKDYKQLTTPDGLSVSKHVNEINAVAEYISYADRCTLKGILDKHAIGSFIVNDNVGSLDLMQEIDESVNVLRSLRQQVVGVSAEGLLTRNDSDTVRAIATTITMIIKNAQLLAKTDRVSALQKGLVSYADTLKEGERVAYLDAIKTHVGLNIKTEI